MLYEVITHVVVQVVDHRGQRRGFTRAGRTRHQDQAARRVDDVAENRWCADVFQRPHGVGNRAEGAAVLADLRAAVGERAKGMSYNFV